MKNNNCMKFKRFSDHSNSNFVYQFNWFSCFIIVINAVYSMPINTTEFPNIILIEKVIDIIDAIWDFIWDLFFIHFLNKSKFLVKMDRDTEILNVRALFSPFSIGFAHFHIFTFQFCVKCNGPTFSNALVLYPSCSLLNSLFLLGSCVKHFIFTKCVNGNDLKISFGFCV